MSTFEPYDCLSKNPLGGWTFSDNPYDGLSKRQTGGMPDPCNFAIVAVEFNMDLVGEMRKLPDFAPFKKILEVLPDPSDEQVYNLYTRTYNTPLTPDIIRETDSDTVEVDVTQPSYLALILNYLSASNMSPVKLIDISSDYMVTVEVDRLNNSKKVFKVIDQAEFYAGHFSADSWYILETLGLTDKTISSPDIVFNGLYAYDIRPEVLQKQQAARTVPTTWVPTAESKMCKSA
jgi:hypothetical protein